MLRLSKQANDEIRRLEESRNRNIMEEREKRQITENQDAIEFWIATARHWHKRAKFLEGVADRERDNTTHAVTEMEIQSIERHHWKQCAEQNHGDVMAAEARTDAMGDILDALARGWRMESYDGCAKWWRYDTDTLQALAKEAREWEQAEDSKPFEVISRDDMIVFCESAYSQGMPMPFDGVRSLSDPDLRHEFDLAHRFVTTANERREREAAQQAARTETTDQASPIDDGKAAQQAETVTESKADGFNGHMIGTDGDRVGFIRHAMNYGFEPEIGPLERLGSDALGDLYSTAFYYMNNNGHPLKVAD